MFVYLGLFCLVLFLFVFAGVSALDQAVATAKKLLSTASVKVLEAKTWPTKLLAANVAMHLRDALNKACV